MDLPKPLVGVHLVAGQLCDLVGGLCGSQKIGRIDRVRFEIRHRCRDHPGLYEAYIIERLVQLPLEHPQRVQSGFAMPDQDQCGAHDTSMLSFGVLVNVQRNRWQVLPQPFPGVVDEIAMAGTSSNDTLLAGTSCAQTPDQTDLTASYPDPCEERFPLLPGAVVDRWARVVVPPQVPQDAAGWLCPCRPTVNAARSPTFTYALFRVRSPEAPRPGPPRRACGRR